MLIEASGCSVMACSNSNVHARSRIKRRKLSPVFSEEQPRPQEEERDEGRDLKKIKLCKPWENLDLILTLQSRDINLQRKIEASFDFVNSEAGNGDGKLQPVSFSRALHFVYDWMQSLLMCTDRNRKSGEPLDPCLNYRCWAVIRSCSEKLSSGPSPNLFRAVAPVLKHALFVLDSHFLLGVESNQLFENALQCLSSLLASNSRAFYNVGMDLWISCVVDVLNIISRVSSREKQASLVAKVLLDLSALLLDHFSSFLRFHPNPKNIFCVFVERLLEQLFEVFALLRLRTKDNCFEQFASMLKIVEDVMLNGLFHPSHISGFLSLRSSTVGQVVKSRGANESYHRHLFNKLEKFIQEKKITALGGFACLLRLFASKAKGQQDGSLSFRGHQVLKKGNAVSGDAQEAILPLFEVFMQFMKPLLRECKNFMEELSRVSGVSEHRLIELHCMLRSVNEILESFIQENIYVRTEDTPEGKHYCFLKEIYDAFYSISIKLHFFWVSELEMCDEVKKMLPLIQREVVVGVGCFLEIEYRVFGDDLVIIWLMLISHLAANISISDTKPCSLLINEILNLGCKLINVYSELRQVITPLFALCKAVKILLKTNDSVADEYKVFSSSFLSSALCLKAAKVLLCSQDLRSTISNAVKSVPEGQAANFIQQLNLDIADALEWIRQNSVSIDGKSFIEQIEIQAELLGRILSEIYTIVLESLSITATNSVSIGTSLKNLIKTLRPSLSCFLQTQTDNVNDFFLFITGIKFSNPEFIECGNSSQVKLQSISWLLLFFFRLYASSRSLYKQSISLMPPDLSHKASESLGDLFTTSCSMDWVEKPEKMDGGYFSWIATSLISLPEAIQILSKHFLSSSFAACAPLVYILQICTLQRLNDLSRLIKAFNFFHQKAQMKLEDENTPSQTSMKVWKKLISGSTREAMELTNFLMGHLSLLNSKRPFDDFFGCGKTSLAYEGEWDRGICSLDEKSLHVAVWLLLCQNTDVWFVYATRKHLKKFVSYLFLFSLPCLSNYGDAMEGSVRRSLCNTVTLQLISLELLRDSVSYEQMMAYTNVSSIFCHILKKLLNPVLLRIPTNSLDLGCSPNYEEILNIFEKKPNDGLDNFSLPGSVSVLPSMLCSENNIGETSSSFSLELKACVNLFNLFCKMPKFYGNAKSFCRYATYMLNIESFLLSNLLNHHEVSLTYDPFELLTLFVSCRRAMKCLVMGSSKNLDTIELRAINVVFNSSSSILWLFKSVYEVAGLSNAYFGERDSSLVQDMIHSLIDQTSYIFMKISEAKAKATLLFPLKELFNKDKTLQDPPCLNDNDSDAWEHVELVADALKEHAEKFLFTFKSYVHPVNLNVFSNISEWNKISSIISCFQALLSGLTSAFDSILKEMSLEISQISKSMFFCFSKLNNHVVVFEELVNVCLKIVVLDDGQMFEDVLSAIAGVELKSFESVSCSKSGNKRSGSSSIRKHKSPASHIKLTIDFFHIVNKINLPKFKISCGSLLQYLFKDLSSQVAFILRQLFITSATILRVKCMPSCDGHLKDQPCNYQFVLWSTIILFATSYVLLQELSESIDQSCWFSFAWLDGVLTFFDVVGSLFSLGDPDISKDVYAYFIILHLKAMGKCISLQGKTAISDTGSHIKMPEAQNETDWNSWRSLEHGKHRFTSFKIKLRMSIKKYLMIPSEVYLKIAIEVIEKRLVGVQQNHTAIYQLSTGNVDGGMVSSDSAASIECFELILECFSGHNKFFKNSLPNLVSAIINIVLHLRKPSIFYTMEIFPDKSTTDAGAVILMCVEVLTKVVGRRSFRMDSCYVSQYFHIPMALFTGFRKLRVSCVNWNFPMLSCNKEEVPFTGRKLYFVDRQFSVELYTSCCRLMCSTIKHQKSEAERCIHLLEESLSTLLSCLEVVDSETAKKAGYFSWELGEAIKCASFLRRIYEEVRHQKDALGKYAYLLLSNYISTFSGFGPSKAGIKREIDEALRPGIYSLIDICTRDDLQKLHSLLSEGPCRSTLATLLQDYKQNFQYEGKI